MKHQQLIGALKVALKGKGITYKDLAKRLGVSEGSVKRVFSQGTFTLERFVEICDICDLSLESLFSMYGKGKPEFLFQFTFEQEKFMAENPDFMAFFESFAIYDSPQDIAKAYGIDEKGLVGYLSKLEKMGVLEWLPGNEAKLLISRKYKRIPDGPIERAFDNDSIKDFVNTPFETNESFNEIMAIALSKSGQKVFKAKLKDLLDEAVNEYEMEQVINTPQELVGIYVGIKPWIQPYWVKAMEKF